MPSHTRSRLRRLPSELPRIGLTIVVVSGLVGLLVGATVLFRKDLIHQPSDRAETSVPSSDFVVVTEQPRDVPEHLEFNGPDGDLGDLREPELTGLCWAHNRYRAHTSLDADVTVVDDPGLLRSAELMDGEFAGEEAALRAEAVGSNLRTWRQEPVLAELRTGGEFGEAELQRASAYLVARSQPPSEHADQTFVVFEVPSTLSVVYIVRMRVGSVVNDDLPHRRNTAIYAHVASPERDGLVRIFRSDVEHACDVLGDR